MSLTAKGTQQESVTDPVDVAILNLAKQSTTDEKGVLQQYTPDDLYFLSISRDAQQLHSRHRITFKTKVMTLLATMLEETTP